MRNDSTSAQDELDGWVRTRAELLVYVRRRVESSESAEDIVQGVLERVRRTNLQTLSNVNAWVYRIAHNAVVDHYRRRRVAVTLDSVAEPIETDSLHEHNEPNAAVQELAACIRPLIEQLAVPYRDALVAVDLNGVTHNRAAALNGLSVSGMKSRVQRGRRYLRELLDICCKVDVSATGAIEHYAARSGSCACDDRALTPLRTT